MTSEQAKALLTIANAVTNSVKEAGDQGAPGGIIYAALMQLGLQFEQFEQIMEALVQAKRLRRSGHLYFVVP